MTGDAGARPNKYLRAPNEAYIALSQSNRQSLGHPDGNSRCPVGSRLLIFVSLLRVTNR